MIMLCLALWFSLHCLQASSNVRQMMLSQHIHVNMRLMEMLVLSITVLAAMRNRGFEATWVKFSPLQERYS